MADPVPKNPRTLLTAGVRILGVTSASVRFRFVMMIRVQDGMIVCQNVYGIVVGVAGQLGVRLVAGPRTGGSVKRARRGI